MEESEKIEFRYYSDILEENIVETMHSKIIDKKNGIYQLNNIPFYGAFIAPDDIFYAEFNEDSNSIIFEHIIEHSGNSVVQVIVLDEKFNTNFLLGQLHEIGCNTENLDEKYFVVEIVKDINYYNIKNILDKLELDERISYAEPILSVKHQDDINFE